MGKIDNKKLTVCSSSSTTLKKKQISNKSSATIKHIHFHVSKSTKTREKSTQITKFGMHTRHNFSQTQTSEFKELDDFKDDYEFANKLAKFNSQSFALESMKKEIASMFYTILTQKVVDNAVCKTLKNRLMCYKLCYAEKALSLENSVLSMCLKKFREIYPNYNVDSSYLLQKIFK